MDKVQKSAKNDKALDELCKRYEGRSANRGANPQKASDRTAKMPKVTPDDQKYVSSGDFVDYYNNCRDYTPEPNVQFDTTVVLQKIERESYEKSKHTETGAGKTTYRDDVKKKLASEARASRSDVGKTVTVVQNGAEKKITKTQDGYLIREKKNGIVGYTEEKPKQTAKEIVRRASAEWIPLEERKKEKCIEGKKAKMPVTLILAIITICLALMLIVGSSVLLATAKAERNELQNEIEALDNEKKLLSEELEKKNKDADIDSFAQDELGMINENYVSVKYIKSDKGDGLDVHSAEESGGLFSIIKWIFPFLD